MSGAVMTTREGGAVRMEHPDRPEPSETEAVEGPFAEDRDAEGAFEIPSAEVASPFVGNGASDEVDGRIAGQLHKLRSRQDELRQKLAAPGSVSIGPATPAADADRVAEDSEYPLPPSALQ